MNIELEHAASPATSSYTYSNKIDDYDNKQSYTIMTILIKACNTPVCCLPNPKHILLHIVIHTLSSSLQDGLEVYLMID